MKSYDVTITETLQMAVLIKAESLAEAEEIAEKNWNDSKYILDADHFKGQILRQRNTLRQRILKDRGRNYNESI